MAGMTRRVVMLLLACAGLTACSNPIAGPSDVLGEWRLQSVQQADHSTTPVAEGARFTIRFEADGRLAVRADCNACGGTYQLEEGSLTTGPLACTRAFCVNTAPLDTVFVTVLDGRSTVRVGSDRLTVSSERGTLIFVR
jgi:heat shock protein HslJ